MELTPANIQIIGVDGQKWNVSGELMGLEGVELDVSPEGLHSEAPFKTIWQQSAYQEGVTYLGNTIEPLDLVMGFNIYGDEGRSWEYVEERFFNSFSPEEPATIVYTSASGRRTLDVTLLEKTKTAVKNDPRLMEYSKMVLTLRAAFPFWKGETRTNTVVFPSGTGTNTVTVYNPTDRPLYLQWACTAPGRWTLPDYSFKRDAQSERKITTPTLTEGQDLTIDTYPRTETYTAADGSNIAGRFFGVDFLHPVPPRTPPTELPVSVENGGANAEVMVRMVEYWKRPHGG